MPGKTETLEKRSLVSPVEARAAGDKVTVGGYAAVFGDMADIGTDFKEVFAPGAFTKTLRSADVRAYFAHDRGRVLGRGSVGTLRLKEDAKGLAVEIDLPDTTDGRDVRALIARGDVSGMSLGFVTIHDEWNMAVTPAIRTIHEVELIEVSVVSEPAYDGTSIALRSLEAARHERRQQNFSAAARRIKDKLDEESGSLSVRWADVRSKA